jgi:hypothetical protein
MEHFFCASSFSRPLSRFSQIEHSGVEHSFSLRERMPGSLTHKLNPRWLKVSVSTPNLHFHGTFLKINRSSDVVLSVTHLNIPPVHVPLVSINGISLTSFPTRVQKEISGTGNALEIDLASRGNLAVRF